MRITEVRVFPVGDAKLRAFASIVIDDAFVVSDIKIINGKNGRFLSMPSTKRKDGTFRDIAHPLNNETRRLIEGKVFGCYDELLASGRHGGHFEPITESGRLEGPAPPKRAAPAASASPPQAPPRQSHAEGYSLRG